MNDLRKAAEMALGALMQRGEHHPKVYQAAETLREALDKPEIEPKALVDMAVLAEREACAQVAENGLIGHTIAQAIRARGEK